MITKTKHNIYYCCLQVCKQNDKNQTNYREEFPWE